MTLELLQLMWAPVRVMAEWAAWMLLARVVQAWVVPAQVKQPRMTRVGVVRRVLMLAHLWLARTTPHRL